MFDSTLDSKQCSVVRHARESGCGFLCRIILLTEEMEDWAGQSFRFSEAFWGIPPRHGDPWNHRVSKVIIYLAKLGIRVRLGPLP
jgi:hypothetical protein